MSFEKLMIAGGALLIALLLVFWLARRNRRGDAYHAAVRSGAPRDLQFVCTRCSQRVPHTRRTVAAFERGTTRLFCDTCHRQWAAGRPRRQLLSRSQSADRPTDKQPSSHAPSSRGRAPRSNSKAPSGCLGVSLLLVAVPIFLLVYAAAV